MTFCIIGIWNLGLNWNLVLGAWIFLRRCVTRYALRITLYEEYAYLCI